MSRNPFQVKYSNPLNTPSLADYQKYIKYIFRFRTGPKYTDDLFNAWHTEKQRQYIDNIKSFKELLFKGFTQWSQTHPRDTPIEYIEIRSRAYKVILDIATDLFLLTAGQEPGPKYILNLTKEFTTLQFTAVAERLKLLDPRAINLLFKSSYHDFKNGSSTIEFTTKTATSILNKLLQDYFNYKIVKVGSCDRIINGSRQKLSKYVIKPIETEHCLISSLNNTIEKLIRETELDVS